MTSEMADPEPENIDGSKSVAYSHEVHHQVPWGHIALAAAVIVVIAFVWANYDLTAEDDEQGPMTA